MPPKPRNKAGMDAAAVARMMAEQDSEAPDVEPAELIASPTPAREEPRVLGPTRTPPSDFDPGKVDGRTLRRTGREPFATRIKPETQAALKRIAYARGITIAEALELAVAAYKTE